METSLNELTPPEPNRPLQKPEEVLGEITDAKSEAKRLREQTALPVIKAIKDELIERAASGKLREELKGKKIGSLIRDLGIIKQILEDNMPKIAIITPPAPATDGKDVTWGRAHSAVQLTDKEREARRKAIEGETA